MSPPKSTASRYLPACDGPLRDLRRGVIRSLPYAFLSAFLLLGHVPTAVVLITLSLCWVPVTLIEGWGVRRPRATPRLIAVILMVWAVLVLGWLGASVQWVYLDNLVSGLDPGQAITDLPKTLAHPYWPWEEILGVGVFSSVMVSSLVAARVLQGMEEGYAELVCMIPGAQVLALALIVGIVAGSTAEGTMVWVLVMAGLPITAIPILVLLWALASAADRTEARVWRGVA